MKTQNIKTKVSGKISKAKSKIKAKCGKAAKCAVIMFAVCLVFAGCTSAEAPTAQRAQTANTNVKFIVQKGGNATFNFGAEFVSLAQANETSGTETMTATNTQTPTNDVKPTTTFTYGLCSTGEGGTDWISQLTAASAKGLASLLKSGKDGKITVTKTDGSTECVECKDGKCSPGSCSDCVYCEDCEVP